MIRRAFVLVLALAGLAGSVMAHESRPGYLELEQTGEETFDVLWKVPAAGNRRLGIYVRFPEATVETREHRGRFSGGAFLDRWSVRCPGGLTGKTIHIDGLRRTLTDVLVRVKLLDGATVVNRIAPPRPSLVLKAKPTFLEHAATYVALGFEHILLGVDHLLFVLGLLLIVSGTASLVRTITAFTLAHSLTLAVATLGWAQVSAAPLNAVIALSILFLGPEIVRKWRGGDSLTLRHPWLVAFGFGLLHGFGFASGLQTIGLPRAEVVLGLLWFNVGVELGQLGFVALALAMAWSFRTLEIRWLEWQERLPGYLVGSCGCWWTIERVVVMFTGG